MAVSAVRSSIRGFMPSSTNLTMNDRLVTNITQPQRFWILQFSTLIDKSNQLIIGKFIGEMGSKQISRDSGFRRKLLVLGTDCLILEMVSLEWAEMILCVSLRNLITILSEGSSMESVPAGWDGLGQDSLAADRCVWSSSTGTVLCSTLVSSTSLSLKGRAMNTCSEGNHRLVVLDIRFVLRLGVRSRDRLVITRCGWRAGSLWFIF